MTMTKQYHNNVNNNNTNNNDSDNRNNNVNDNNDNTNTTTTTTTTTTNHDNNTNNDNMNDNDNNDNNHKVLGIETELGEVFDQFHVNQEDEAAKEDSDGKQACADERACRRVGYPWQDPCVFLCLECKCT